MMDTIDCGILIKILFWPESFYRLKSEAQYNNINYKSEINQLKMLAKAGRGVCTGLCLYMYVCVCVNIAPSILNGAMLFPFLCIPKRVYFCKSQRTRIFTL